MPNADSINKQLDDRMRHTTKTCRSALTTTPGQPPFVGSAVSTAALKMVADFVMGACPRSVAHDAFRPRSLRIQAALTVRNGLADQVQPLSPIRAPSGHAPSSGKENQLPTTSLPEHWPCRAPLPNPNALSRPTCFPVSP